MQPSKRTVHIIRSKSESNTIKSEANSTDINSPSDNSSVAETPKSKKVSTPEILEDKKADLSPYSDENPEVAGKYGSRKDWCENFSFDKIEITKVTEERRNSVVVFGKQKDVKNPKEIIIKLTLDDPPDNNSLSVERAVYRTIVPELLKEVPHLVGYIDDFYCTDIKKNLRRMCRDESLDLKRRMDLAEIYYQLSMIKNGKRYENKKYDEKKIYILLTERAPGYSVGHWMESSLYKYFYEDKDRWEFERDVSLQVAITLKEMAKKKLMHNDLHMGNIYVEKLPRFKLPYTVNDKEIYTEYFVRIFDFDHSSVEGVIRNTYLDKIMCTQFGECNKFLAKWDWFTYLDEINYHNEDSKMQAYFPDFARFPENEKFREKGLRPHRGRACICMDKGCNNSKLQTAWLDSIVSLNDYIKSAVKDMMEPED